MIRIDEITRGRFGNRILHYNNLVQLASELGVEASCSPWEGYNLFSNLVSYKESSNSEELLLWSDILQKDSYEEHDYVVGPYCLHNTFWKVTKKDLI